jgi:phage major head subunit gpT-like protein
MQKWEGERKVRELSGSEFTVVNDDFELTYGIKRDALLDRSRIQGISDYITKMGEAAAEHKDRLAWEFLDLQGTTALCYDGTPLIGATHPLKKGSDWSNIDTTGAGPKWFLMDTRTSNRAVLFQTRESYALEVLNADGENNVRGFMRREHLVGAFSRVAVAPAMPHRIFQSTALLDSAGFSDARAQMRRFKGDGDRPIMVQPNVLMVPPELETTALELMQNERNSSGASNILRGAAEVVVNPFLA